MAQEADHYKQEFERLLLQVIALNNGIVDGKILASGEILTEFTAGAERQTARLTGIPINQRITALQARLLCKKLLYHRRTNLSGQSIESNGTAIVRWSYQTERKNFKRSAQLPNVHHELSAADRAYSAGSKTLSDLCLCIGERKRS